MKNKILISSVVLLVIAAAITGWSLYTTKAQSSAAIQTFTIKKTDLVESVLVSGVVKSGKSENVYSKVTDYPIKKVNVEVGSKVKAGDVLVELDTASLALDIRRSELNIINAEDALKNEDSSNAYNLHNGSNSVETASIELENAQKTFEQTKVLYESGASSRDEFQKAETALKKAQIAYNDVQTALENTKSKNTTAAQNNIELQKVELEKLKNTLKDSKITAPIDGTVTLANAKVGGSLKDLLFVVEDTENVLVSSQIGEYDISFIKLGQEAVIKTDSTGDKQFVGIVSKIAPAAVKDANGNTAASSNVQFNIEIALKDKDPNIKIDMNARLTIKLDEKKAVYSVPHDAIVTETDGNKYINVIETTQNSSNSQNTPQRIKVQTGMKTDMYTEIDSPELKEGMNVVINSKDSTK